jgi:hypothetical protein
MSSAAHAAQEKRKRHAIGITGILRIRHDLYRKLKRCGHQRQTLAIERVLALQG